MNFPISSVQDLEHISSSAKWQYFEKLTAFIFDQNGYEAKQNVIAKFEGTKRQFDVIAKGTGKTFLVECKKWKSRKEMAPALKSAVRNHLERCAVYSAMHDSENVLPLLVTLAESEILQHEDTFIVPIMKLNWFINNFDGARILIKIAHKNNY